MSITNDFQQRLQQEQTANQHLIEGHTEPFKALWSHADDVTIFGGWGGYEKGWEQVVPVLEGAGAGMRDGKMTSEMLSMGTSGDLAYVIWVDRFQVRMVGRDELRSMALRVTHIYRREEGTWKIIHRHADPLTDETGPRAALQ